MRLRICDVSFHLTNCHTRIPFRFGIHTMTAAPLCVTRAVVEAESGERAEGYSSDLLVPKWFEKNPDQSIEDDWRRLCSSARAAAHVACENHAPATVFKHWRRIHADRVGGAPPDATDLLVRGLGVSLIERALIDSACRLAGVPFVDGLRSDLFGTSAEPRLTRAIASLPEPRRSIAVRHTVGLADPLDDGDVQEDQHANDGVPVTLADNIRRYGLTHFKIKLSGNPEDDLIRLRRIAVVIRSNEVNKPLITLDGNEQFESIAALDALIDPLLGWGETNWLLDHLRYVEQPLPRARTFDAESHQGIGELWPCIIDEADFDESSFPRAIELGYRGVSVKNCKGVFRALLNRTVCDLHGGDCFQSGEDLTNLPIIALQQDLTTAATLGLGHVERNGHHYFRGLDHLPKPEQEEAVQRHADLYERHESGMRLRIRGGRLEIGSILDCSGYGFDVFPRLDERTPMDTWSPVAT